MRTTLLFLALAVAVGAGCDAYLAGGTLADDDPTSSPASPIDTGFPCDVAATLETNCMPCHGGNLYITSLATRDLWLAVRFDGKSNGQYAAEQVAAGKMPPPTVRTQPPEADRALLIDWVASGMPAGRCGPLTPVNP
ncbi:MAG TPA: hypothetical protein VN903_07480 [Polyangia bacterium]|jgi:hypothetical protein|nr:hypothetical protein [Polyangia bacterium]